MSKISGRRSRGFKSTVNWTIRAAATVCIAIVPGARHQPEEHWNMLLHHKVKLLSRVWLFATPWAVACTRLLHPWDFLGKSAGVGHHFLLQGIFLTQGSNPGLPHRRQTLYHLNHQGSNKTFLFMNFIMNKTVLAKTLLSFSFFTH